MSPAAQPQAAARRVVILAGAGVGPEAARRAEPILRSAFPRVEYVVSSYDAAENGDLKSFLRTHKFDGALLGPLGPGEDDPLMAPTLLGDGAARGWMTAGSEGAPLWILEPSRGEARDLLEMDSPPAEVIRLHRRLSLRHRGLPTIVMVPDRASIRVTLRTAMGLAPNGPIGALWPPHPKSRVFLKEIDPAAGALIQEIDPTRASYQLSSGQEQELPGVIVASNTYGPLLGGILAARRGPAMVPLVYRTPHLWAVRVGHGPLASLAGQDRIGPVGFLAAAAALHLILGPEERARRLLWVLAQWADDPRRRTPELGGEASPTLVADSLPQRLSLTSDSSTAVDTTLRQGPPNP